MSIKKKIKSIIKKNSNINITIQHSVNEELFMGKSVVVTGGGTGIGYSIAQKFVESGAQVLIVGRNEERLRNAMYRLGKEKVQYVVCDLSRYEETVGFLKTILPLLSGKIDILINNAGINRGIGKEHDFLGCTEEDYNLVMDTNLKSMFFLCQSFIKYYLDNGIRGHIVNICSINGMRPVTSPYGISKWGCVGLTKGLGVRYARDGIVVNGISPGATATNMMNFKEGDTYALDRIPNGRFTLPEEIANLAVFLASDQADAMAGAVVTCDGGELLWNR